MLSSHNYYDFLLGDCRSLPSSLLHHLLNISRLFFFLRSDDHLRDLIVAQGIFDRLHFPVYLLLFCYLCAFCQLMNEP